MLHGPIGDQTDRPTLIKCMKFDGKKKIINIPQEIGVKYHNFGLLLLEDHNGAKIRSLAHKHMMDAKEINNYRNH